MEPEGEYEVVENRFQRRTTGPLGIAQGFSAFILALFFIVVAPHSYAQSSDAYVLKNVEQRTIPAKNGDIYRVFIIKPQAPAPESGYPVLYALDGNSVAALFSTLSRSHSGRNELSGFEPGLVVAVGYPTDNLLDMRRRSRDYTPAKATPNSGTYLKPEDTGDAERFLDFIEQELKPAIQAEFKTNPSRQSIYGHSFGGLFVLHALLTRPGTFANYISASPSIWWADRAILKTSAEFLSRKPALNSVSVFLMVGGLEQTVTPDQASAKDAKDIAIRLQERRMVGDAREMAERLASLKERGLSVRFEEIPNETHNSVTLLSAIKAYRFAFQIRKPVK